MLETTFDLLPADILSHISRVDVLPRGHGSLARMWQNRGYGRGILEVNRELFTKDERARELITLHEVAGHGLLDAAHALSPEQFGHIQTKWRSIFELFPDLINKDKNGSSEIHKDEEGISGLSLNEEEFIADRLAEYFVARSKKYNDEQITFLRKPETPFTADEETIVRNACEETYGTFVAITQQQEKVLNSPHPQAEMKKAAIDQRLGEFIGAGESKVVHASAHDDNKVVATENSEGREVFVDPELAKMQFYLGKILHDLFPDNFPSIHFAQGGNQKAAQYVRERIHADGITPDEKEFGKARTALIEKVRAAGFRGREFGRKIFGPLDETNSKNFIWRNGQLVYIDDIEPLRASREVTADKEPSDDGTIDIKLDPWEEAEDGDYSIIDRQQFFHHLQTLPADKAERVKSWYGRYEQLVKSFDVTKNVVHIAETKEELLAA